MTDIKDLMARLEAQENAFKTTEFLAPCLAGGQIRARIAGVVQTLTPRGRQFNGWGIFRAVSAKNARLVEEASLTQIARYLQLLPMLRVRLGFAIQNTTWVAYPANVGDYQQRFKASGPVIVHLVTEPEAYEQCTVRWDGAAFWFEGLDRTADPRHAHIMRQADRDMVEPDQLREKGLTPEMRTLYDMVFTRSYKMREEYARGRDQKRLQRALEQGGGALDDFKDQGDYWTVEWRTADGHRHTSAISKNDLTVVSAGICLSGLDRNFDLQSLVGIVERMEDF